MEEKPKYLIHVNASLRLCTEWGNSLRNEATLGSPHCLDARTFINEYISAVAYARTSAGADRGADRRALAQDQHWYARAVGSEHLRHWDWTWRSLTACGVGGIGAWTWSEKEAFLEVDGKSVLNPRLTWTFRHVFLRVWTWCPSWDFCRTLFKMSLFGWTHNHS